MGRRPLLRSRWRTLLDILKETDLEMTNHPSGFELDVVLHEFLAQISLENSEISQ